LKKKAASSVTKFSNNLKESSKLSIQGYFYFFVKYNLCDPTCDVGQLPRCPALRSLVMWPMEFREQYCISNKQLDLLELEKSKKDRFLGCLSQYHIEILRRTVYVFLARNVFIPIRFGQPSPAPPELCAYDADLECSYFRRRPRSVCSQPDPKRYTWMPEDEDFTRMEWPQSVIEDNAGWPQNYNVDQIACPAHTPIPPPPPPPPLTIPPHRTKHVSFARSHTLTTFDDSVMPAAVSGNRYRRDCERLIDGRVVKSDALGRTLTTFDDSVMPAAVSGNCYRRDCERLIDGPRSHTLTTFDDSVMPAAVSGNRYRRDCERLIDGRVVKSHTDDLRRLCHASCRQRESLQERLRETD
ncbi:putative serine/threonine-protein kinase, partial [Operophtera brumata]